LAIFSPLSVGFIGTVTGWPSLGRAIGSCLLGPVTPSLTLLCLLAGKATPFGKLGPEYTAQGDWGTEAGADLVLVWRNVPCQQTRTRLLFGICDIASIWKRGPIPAETGPVKRQKDTVRDGV